MSFISRARKGGSTIALRQPPSEVARHRRAVKQSEVGDEVASEVLPLVANRSRLRDGLKFEWQLRRCKRVP